MGDEKNQLRELLDKQAIHESILRYCRGVDRFDRELILSAYHPDAIDEHGPFNGTPEQFVEWVFQFNRDHLTLHQHLVLNHLAEIDGDAAHAETYWLSIGGNPQAAEPLTLAGGRYVDRFERRRGRWAIAHRVCVHEWRSGLRDLGRNGVAALFANGVRGPDDISYKRPL